MCVCVFYFFTLQHTLHCTYPGSVFSTRLKLEAGTVLSLYMHVAVLSPGWSEDRDPSCARREGTKRKEGQDPSTSYRQGLQDEVRRGLEIPDDTLRF